MSEPTFRFWSDADLDALPAVPWLWGARLPCSGLGVLYGASGVGKSFFALALAVSVALGREWLGRPVRKGPVVYVAAEGGRTLAPRLAALKEWHGVTAVPDLIVVPDTVYLHDARHLGAYLAQLRQRLPAPVALSVFDTLSRCSAGSDENSNADREVTVAGLGHIRTATEGAILAVHHTGWNEDRMRGGYALQAAADAILALKRVEGGVQLKVEKQRDGEDGETIDLCLKPYLHSLVIMSGVTLGVLSEKSRKLLKTLDDMALSDGISTSAWEKGSNLPTSSFYAARKQLLTEGYIEPLHGSKRWIPSERGRELLQLQGNSKELQRPPAPTLLQTHPSKGCGVVEQSLELTEEEERLAIVGEGSI